MFVQISWSFFLLQFGYLFLDMYNGLLWATYWLPVLVNISTDVIKYHEQKQLMRGFVLAYGSQGIRVLYGGDSSQQAVGTVAGAGNGQNTSLKTNMK